MEKALDTSVEQLMLIMGGARRQFAKSLESYLESRNMELNPDDRESVGKLFTETFQTLLLAEIPALISFVLYERLQNRDVLTEFVPEFLDACEAKIGDVPASLAQKTKQLAELARTVLESGDKKRDVVEALCRDLIDMDSKGKLRASYNAQLLTLLGE